MANTNSTNLNNCYLRDEIEKVLENNWADLAMNKTSEATNQILSLIEQSLPEQRYGVDLGKQKRTIRNPDAAYGWNACLQDIKERLGLTNQSNKEVE